MGDGHFMPERRARFRLGGHWVTPSANEIGGMRIDAKAMAVLMALVEAAPDVVPHAELLECVWPDVVVVDNVVHQAISQLRKALHDDARVPRYIENIPRRGYRLLSNTLIDVPTGAMKAHAAGYAPNGFDDAPFYDGVVLWQANDTTRRNGTRTTSRSTSADTAFHGLSAGPAREGPLSQVASFESTSQNSILVLPLNNLGDECETSHFAAGVHEDLLARLSRIEGLAVTSRTSAVALASQGKDVPQMAIKAGVRNVLTGSIRRAGDRVRVSVQLIALPQDSVLWADTFDRQLTDIFAVQDELAQAIATQLRVRFDERLRDAFARASMSAAIREEAPALLQPESVFGKPTQS